jgi:hypothetical protein
VHVDRIVEEIAERQRLLDPKRPERVAQKLRSAGLR